MLVDEQPLPILMGDRNLHRRQEGIADRDRCAKISGVSTLFAFGRIVAWLTSFVPCPLQTVFDPKALLVLQDLEEGNCGTL